MTGVTPPAAPMYAEAIGYAARGILIFPLWWVVDGVCACAAGARCGSPGKHPRVPHGLTDATAEADRIRAWWHRWPLANIGVPAGANGLGMIDVDPGKGGDDTLAMLVDYCASKGVDLMATRTVRTGSGGLHLYFRDPTGRVKTASKTFGAPGVDTRGRGGYVVGPPSLHASGERYSFTHNGFLLARWPPILTPLQEARRTTGSGWVAPAPVAAERPAPRANGESREQRWARRGLAMEAEQLRAMTRPDSGRNDALNRSAYKMGRRVGAGLLDENEAYTALVDAASGWAGHTPRTIDATVRSGLTAGKARPHNGPTAGGRA